MSTHLTKLVRNWTFGNPTTKLIARELAECCTNDQGKKIFPSLTHIEKATDCHRNTIQKSLKRLEALNVIRTTKKGSGRTTSQIEFTEGWISQAEANLITIETAKNSRRKQKLETKPKEPHNPFNYSNPHTGDIIKFPPSHQTKPTFQPKEKDDFAQIGEINLNNPHLAGLNKQLARIAERFNKKELHP
ncbi:MAG TPA: helix-turn-helix domain-containing protein [Oculatellaceae cyanobacterium]